jgi:hypothetical protein
MGTPSLDAPVGVIGVGTRNRGATALLAAGR